MKSIIVLASLVFSFSGFAAKNLTPCGQHAAELKYPDLNWEKIYTVSLKSAFGDADSVVCGGFDTKTVKVLVYRDSDNHAMVDKVEAFLNPRIILSSDMLSQGTQFMIRKGTFVSFRINKVTNLKSEVVRLEMSTRFLRNISRGLGGSDFRDLVVISDFSLNDRRFTNRVKESRNAFTFDHADLRLKVVPIKINEVHFYNKGQEVESFKTNVLPTIESLN